MKHYQCPVCENVVYFDNLECACGQDLSFAPDLDRMEKLTQGCANRQSIACNWTASERKDGLCRSCAMTTTHPDLAVEENARHWGQAEAAKRWVLVNLMRWGWFAEGAPAPEFKLLSEVTRSGDAPITMGHADGLITINVSEVSDALRVARREQLSERYRTMIGHLRHEIAHFLFFVLCRDTGFTEDFRALFGDERADYGAALKQHYAKSPSQPGPDYITPYATAHPHEDWAESAAHLMHLIDLLDSMAQAGLAGPDGPKPGSDPYADRDTDRLLDMAGAAALAINHVNRSLDLPDLYPFALTEGVREKLAFVHRHIRISAPVAEKLVV